MKKLHRLYPNVPEDRTSASRLPVQANSHMRSNMNLTEAEAVTLIKPSAFSDRTIAWV